MKFIGHQLTQTVFLETEDGTSYRTDPLGKYWECYTAKAGKVYGAQRKKGVRLPTWRT